MHIVPRGYTAGSGASTQIGSLVIDATSKSAYWLGFVKGMQYSGLDRGDLEGANVELTNCFATTYALMEDFQTQAYNLQTFASEAGTIKLFDTLIMDPGHIFMDFTVEWEMCNLSAIFGQFKSMAGGDMASIANNATRELMVIAFESPEAFETIMEVKKAAECTKDAYDEINEEGEEGQEGERGDEANWDNWQSDVDNGKATAAAAQDCFGAVDRWEIGNISGRLFGSFFDNELQPV